MSDQIDFPRDTKMPAAPILPCPLWLTRSFFALTGIGVAMGAFGAHALKDLRTPTQLETWKTATFYLLIHSLAGAILSLFARSQKIPAIPNYVMFFFLAGCVLFAGSLYALVLTQISLLGAITPLGGFLFILGWCTLAVRVR
jgi:uncharacterized membrane protein YgdD (TMEM256/DUF423 family)